jgi:hypothetical protein
LLFIYLFEKAFPGSDAWIFFFFSPPPPPFLFCRWTPPKTQSVKNCKLNSSNIFRELPISIGTSTLAKALVHEMAVVPKNEQHDSLQVSNHLYLERNLESLTESVELLTSEQIKAHGYLRAHAKQQILQEQYHKKKVGRPFPSPSFSYGPFFLRLPAGF